MKPIRIIEVVQPYATLIAIGAKQYHTFRAGMNHSGLVLIYAPDIWSDSQDAICRHPHVRVCLRAFGFSKKSDFAFGRVMAVSSLTSCVNMYNSREFVHINMIDGLDVDTAVWSDGLWCYEFFSSFLVDGIEADVARGPKLSYSESKLIYDLVEKKEKSEKKPLTCFANVV